MFGLGTYIAGAAVAASLAWGGYQTIRAQGAVINLERSKASEARALGSLETCANRLTNLKEAAESNASIPDNLTDFDIPDSWMLPSAGADAATD